MPGKRHVDYEIHLKNPQVKTKSDAPEHGLCCRKTNGFDSSASKNKLSMHRLDFRNDEPPPPRSPSLRHPPSVDIGCARIPADKTFTQ